MEYELNELIKNIQSKDKISISYIQRTYNFGFPKAGRIFYKLVGDGYISITGEVNKSKVYDTLGEEHKPGIKIIFLDVDGVLNCHSTKDLCGPYKGIEDKKVVLLKELVDKTGAVIVLVSSWKEWWTSNPKFKDKQDDLANYLDEKLAKQGLVIKDKTHDYNSVRRGRGILRYLNSLHENNISVDKYVILDDEMFDYLETKMTKHLIQTSYYQNVLEKKHVRKAIEKLN